MRSTLLFPVVATLLIGLLFTQSARATGPIKVSVEWDKLIATSRTTPSLAIVFYPELRKGSPIHDEAWRAVQELDADYVRYQFWYVFPGLSVAALDAPTKEKTSWDFSVLDPTVTEFMNMTKGKEPILQFSTIPQWMFKTDKPVRYPVDRNQPGHMVEPLSYSQGTELVDPSAQQVADYFARLFSWYAKGGFTDENGKYHHSGHNYEIPWWAVLNEVQAEHQMTPQQYVKIYDAVALAIRKISPTTKFVGPALAPMGRLNGHKKGWRPGPEPDFFEYFLDPKNHAPGVPLDMLSYHFYATTSPSQTIDSWQYTFFDQADGFLINVAFIESIRKRLSPTTRVNLDELGILLSQDYGGPPAETPEAYWNLYGAFYAYLYVELAKIGIDVATLSELVNSQGNQPSCGVLNWETGKPRATLRVLKLIRDNFGPGDKLLATNYPMQPLSDVDAQAFETPKGRRLLLFNKRLYPAEIDVTGVGRVSGMEVVDGSTGEGPPRKSGSMAGTVRLEAFAVAVLSIEK